MSRLIVYLKSTTMDKVLSLIDKLKKYDIVDDVAHVTEETAQQIVQRTVCPACNGKGLIKTNWVGLVVCTTCGGTGNTKPRALDSLRDGGKKPDVIIFDDIHDQNPKGKP